MERENSLSSLTAEEAVAYRALLRRRFGQASKNSQRPSRDAYNNAPPSDVAEMGRGLAQYLLP
ncbi:hypothetical protein BN2476_560108 [Paraburkholderia piptadeniae]|uniref:Uncharacterized protein n=1 Tax=Paraburkholderia piptadeniae TaxID=1701573 RepID=A0A1N7SIW1_9BURK|nr:hypothetical protein BN2476_560108 [Paraburkholderia piptadeniae]